MVNYTATAKRARDLIHRYGRNQGGAVRSVVLRRITPTTTDPSKPWNGGAPGVSNTSLTVVLFEVIDKSDEMESIASGRRELYISPLDLSFKPSENDKVVIDDEEWGIENILEYAPGPVSLLLKVRINKEVIPR